MTKYDDYDWEELPAEAKAAAAVLGFTQKLWDEDDEPDACDEYWKDLTPAQQQAATVLGYNKKSWDKS